MSYGGPKVSRQFQLRSRQFQFHHGNFNFVHGNFNFVTAISISPRQFQFCHGNFNFITAILTLFTAISILSLQFFSTCLRTGNSRLGFQRPIAIWVITHNADGAHCLWRDVSWRSTWRDVLWTLWFVHSKFTTVLYKL